MHGALLLLSLLAAADPTHGTPDKDGTPFDRRGTIVSAAGGYGWINRSYGRFGAGALALTVGATLSRRGAPILDYSAVLGATDLHSKGQSQHFLMLGAQGFFARYFWIKGGGGLAFLRILDPERKSPNDNEYASQTAIGLMAAVGGELLQTSLGLTIDLQARIAIGIYDHSTTTASLLLGASWF